MTTPAKHYIDRLNALVKKAEDFDKIATDGKRFIYPNLLAPLHEALNNIEFIIEERIVKNDIDKPLVNMVQTVGAKKTLQFLKQNLKKK